MDRIIYRVDKDISLEEIAEKFNTTPSAISKLNNLDGEIFVGLRLLIEPREGSYYTVQPFDTVASIAKKLGVKRRCDQRGQFGQDIHRAEDFCLFGGKAD